MKNLNSFKRFYQQFEGQGHLLQRNIQYGFRVHFDDIEGSIKNFQRYARKEGWKTQVDKDQNFVYCY